MNHYLYEGPVTMFTKIITEKWVGETRAISDKKATSNLSYQFKKEHGLSKSTKIGLVNKHLIHVLL